MFRLFVSEFHDPYINQAIEACLFYHSKDPILFLYVNEPCVVIGRHQNPWMETFVDDLKVPLIRRLSGGGTVYHDLGNINFAFIHNKDESNVEKNFKVITDVLNDLSIFPTINERNDLILEERKFSGNAFYNRGKRRLHHGTLLVDASYDDLWIHLNFNHENFSGKSVRSRKSQVINLHEVNHGISVEGVIRAFEDKLQSYTFPLPVTYQDYLKQFKSNEWVLCETPKFTYDINNKKWLIDKGLIQNEPLKGKIFSKKLIKKEVENVFEFI